MIAGKGGEKYQEIRGKKYSYNDFDVVYNFYRKKLKTVDNKSKLSKNENNFDENDIEKE